MCELWLQVYEYTRTLRRWRAIFRFCWLCELCERIGWALPPCRCDTNPKRLPLPAAPHRPRARRSPSRRGVSGGSPSAPRSGPRPSPRPWRHCACRPASTPSRACPASSSTTAPTDVAQRPVPTLRSPPASPSPSQSTRRRQQGPWRWPSPKAAPPGRAPPAQRSSRSENRRLMRSSGQGAALRPGKPRCRPATPFSLWLQAATCRVSGGMLDVTLRRDAWDRDGSIQCFQLRSSPNV